MDTGALGVRAGGVGAEPLRCGRCAARLERWGGLSLVCAPCRRPRVSEAASAGPAMWPAHPPRARGAVLKTYRKLSPCTTVVQLRIDRMGRAQRRIGEKDLHAAFRGKNLTRGVAAPLRGP